MGNLLLACCAFIQARNLFYIFGAISMVMVFAASFIEKLIEERKNALATETPADDSDDQPATEDADIEPMADEEVIEEAPQAV